MSVNVQMSEDKISEHNNHVVNKLFFSWFGLVKIVYKPTHKNTEHSVNVDVSHFNKRHFTVRQPIKMARRNFLSTSF